MASLNKVQIIGKLGRDPEVRYSGDGRAIANLNVATSEKWKDVQGNKQERTEWIKIVIFSNLAEVAGKYLKKGSQAYFEGKLQTRKYTDNAGIEKYITEVVVDQKGQMVMLGGKSEKRSESAQDNFDDDIDSSIPF